MVPGCSTAVPCFMGSVCRRGPSTTSFSKVSAGCSDASEIHLKAEISPSKVGGSATSSTRGLVPASVGRGRGWPYPDEQLGDKAALAGCQN